MKRTMTWVLLGTLTLATGCSPSKQTSSNSEDTAPAILKVAIESELSTADVSLAMDNTACSVMSQVAEGLFSFDEKGEAKPAIAEGKVEPTNDGMTYTFTLRKDAVWSNGEPVTAADFEYSWKRTVTPATMSPQAYYFEGIKNYKAIEAGEKEPAALGVTALDEQTLQVDLEYPMSYFQQLLAVPAFFPLKQTFVEEQGTNYGTTSATTLFNGPFVMTDWDGLGNAWHYEKNEQYWDSENVALDQIDVEVIKEISTGKNLFDAEQLDFVKISGEIVAQEKTNPALMIRELPGTYYIQLNTQNEIFDNLNARKAVALALDSEKLADNVLNDGSKKALGFVPTGFVSQTSGQDFAEEIGDINPYDEKEAGELWQTALTELAIEEAEITILCSDSDSAKKISEFMQGALTERLKGLSVSVSAVPFNNRLEKSRSGEFDIVLGGWTPVYADPIDFLTLLHSETSNNFGRWSNAKFDALLADANKTYANDYDKRWQTLQEADRLVAEEAPLVPLYQITEAYLVNPRVSGLTFGPLGSIYYKDVQLED